MGTLGGAIETITLLLSITDKLMDKFPNYSQRKREEFRDLKRAYLEEMKSNYRDDEKVDLLRDEIKLFVEAFSKELE